MHQEMNQEDLAIHKTAFASTLTQLNKKIDEVVQTQAQDQAQDPTPTAPVPAPPVSKTQTAQSKNYGKILARGTAEILSSTVLVSLVQETYGYPGVLSLVLLVEGASRLGQWAGAISPCRATTNTESVAAGCFFSGLFGGSPLRIVTGAAAFIYAEREHQKIHPRNS